MRRYGLLIILLILRGGGLISQCPNDICPTASYLPPEVWTPFCNQDCDYDFYNGTWGTMDNTVGNFGNQCYAHSYDQWFQFEYPQEATGNLCLHIINGDCLAPIPDWSIQYGWHEGWVMTLWKGDFCTSAEIVFGTNCYWFSADEPGLITDIVGVEPWDPSRQEQHIELSGVPPGNYWIQIDGQGWCKGCGEISWCHSLNFLDLEDEEMEIEFVSKPRKEVTNHGFYILHPEFKTDILGRIIK